MEYGSSVICIGTWQDFIPWCTIWKGTLQDCMDHIRGVHDVPWSDSLTAQHSGISTDVLLFSDIHLSLVHHNRIHKRGLPHSLISHSGEITCLSCARCCRCRQSSRRMEWSCQTPPARVHYVRLSLRKSWIGRLGRPDMLTGGGDQCA